MAAGLAESAEKNPHVLLGGALLLATIEVLSLGALAAMAAWLFEVLPWWTPIVGNLLAAGTMVFYLWNAHPALRPKLREPIEEETIWPA